MHTRTLDLVVSTRREYSSTYIADQLVLNRSSVRHSGGCQLPPESIPMDSQKLITTSISHFLPTAKPHKQTTALCERSLAVIYGVSCMGT